MKTVVSVVNNQLRKSVGKGRGCDFLKGYCRFSSGVPPYFLSSLGGFSFPSSKSPCHLLNDESKKKALFQNIANFSSAAEGTDKVAGKQAGKVAGKMAGKMAGKTAGVEEEDLVKIEKMGDKGIAIVRLNRPKALNALCSALCTELVNTFRALDEDDEVRAIILTGSEKAFAAGADIKEMKDVDFPTAFKSDLLNQWNEIQCIRKPLIAGVSGYALGGGCELAMMCDIVLAAQNAKFGQPEVLIGTIPGMGGSQRLTRAMGKSRAMEFILTGNHFDAQQAYEAGLVSRVVPTENLIEECVKLAENIAQKSLPILMAAKECVNTAFESSLQEGLAYERRLFHGTFSTEDKKEGMTAFIEKRKPQWKHQ